MSKKLIAIAFLSLQIFVVCGHILLYQYFAYQSDRVFNERISKNQYNTNDLVEIKVPLKTHVAQNWNYFEPISGQVQFKNTCYNYVKLKLTRDTIYLVCIPNYEKTRLFNQNIIDARQIPDIPVDKKSHVPFGKPINLSAYSYPLTLFRFTPALTDVSLNNNQFNKYPIQRYILTPERPPRMLS